MRRAFASSTLALWLFLVTLASASPASAQGPVGPRPPRLPRNDAVNLPYSGIVTEVTKDSITIQWTATPGEKPKTFPVSKTLAAGKVAMEPRLMPGQTRGYHVSPPNMYRLTDVKVGDWVGIHFAYLGGVCTCDHIRIFKRPGGTVPPLPEEAEALWKLHAPRPYVPYHEGMNAYWDLQDKGIPYPEKFGHRRRFPVAPEPREVKLGAAIAP
jgi:hypothetical protein